VRIVIAYNPVSGRGTSAAAAEEISAAITSAGHDVITVPSTPEPADRWLGDEIKTASLLIVCGGDGTLCTVAAVASHHGVALWQAPLGTENLFAQTWGMSRDPAAITAAIEAWKIRMIDRGHVDLGNAGAKEFLLMLSAGFDAHVVLDLASRRRRRITHWSYLRPILMQLLVYRPEIVTITVDGTTIVQDQPGGVIIANCHRYAAHLDPCPGALMDDGHLDVIWYPTPTRWSILAWIWRFRRRSASAHASAVTATGRRITVHSDPPSIWQIDGDPACRRGQGISDVQVTLETGSVRVLLPAET
jgi:diacylglycerol kinase (ATP)